MFWQASPLLFVSLAAQETKLAVVAAALPLWDKWPMSHASGDEANNLQPPLRC